MFRLTFLLLAAIGITMLVVGNDQNGQSRQVAGAQRVTDPALLAGKPASPPVVVAASVDYGRPASVDRLLGVEPRPKAAPVTLEAQPDAELVTASLSLAPEAEGASPRRREFLSVNDEVAARRAAAADRAAAASSAEEAVSAGVDVALADATIAMVTGNRVNVRSGPSTDYAVVGQVTFGEAAEVLSDNNGGWVQIRIQGDGVEGFVAARYLEGGGLNN